MNNHDQLILRILFDKKRRINSNRIRKIYKYPNIEEYLLNRYHDSFSIKETLFRISRNIEAHPKCPICGKYVKFRGASFKPFEYHCSISCAQKSPITKNKIASTCMERYGVINGGASKQAQEKIKNTLMNHYGVDNPAKSDVIKKRIIQTTLERYGVDNTAKSSQAKKAYKKSMQQKYGVDNAYQAKEVKEKIKNTLIERYGVDNPLKCDKFKNKLVDTCLKKYGVTNGGASKESLEKISRTKRNNHTFSTSKPEEQLYKDICDIYPSVIRQYKEERYPSHCDFYIPELDMFIELQGSWTHGKHPYSSTSKEDSSILEQWKERSKEHPFYKSAITTWTISDVNKRETAKKNNLNYVELFSKEDIQLFLTELSKKRRNETEQ